MHEKNRCFVSFAQFIKTILGNGNRDDPFRAAVATPQSLLNLKRQAEAVPSQSFFAADSTFRIVVQEYAVVFYTTVDSHRHTHLVACGIFSSESEDAHVWLIQAIKEKLAEMYAFEWNPVYAMGDAANVFIQAVRRVWGDSPGATGPTM